MQARLEHDYDTNERLEFNWLQYKDDLQEPDDPETEEEEWSTEEIPEENKEREMAWTNLNNKIREKENLSMMDVDEIARNLKNYDKGTYLGVLKKKWFQRNAEEQRRQDRTDLAKTELVDAAVGLKRYLRHIKEHLNEKKEFVSHLISKT